MLVIAVYLLGVFVTACAARKLKSEEAVALGCIWPVLPIYAVAKLGVWISDA